MFTHRSAEACNSWVRKQMLKPFFLILDCSTLNPESSVSRIYKNNGFLQVFLIFSKILKAELL